MPAYTFLRSRMVVSAMLVTLAPGCSVQNAQSNPELGASSGGGAAVLPAAPPAAPKPPAVSAPVLAAPREEAPAPTQAATPRDARPSRNITVTASGGDAMELAAPPKHGTVAISSSGSAARSGRYTPTPGYLGDDQFSLSLAGGRQTVTVSIVAGPP